MGNLGPSLCVVASAILFSTGGAAIKAASLTSWQVASFRSGVAALAVLTLLPAARRWNKRILLVALFYALTLVGFVIANKLTTAANAIFLQATAPLYLLVASPLLLREPVTSRDVALVAVIGAGMALFLTAGDPASRTAPDPMRGNLIGAATGICFACTIGGFRWVQKHAASGDAGMAAVGAGNVLAFAIALGPALPVERVTNADALVVLYLGIFQIGLAYLLLTRGVRGMPALKSSLLLLAEPALNPVWAGLVHGEWPSLQSMAGGALILGATAAQLLWRDPRQN